MQTDLARTLADIADPLPDVQTRTVTYDRSHEVTWEGIVIRVPYRIENERDRATDYPDVSLAPVRMWSVVSVDECGPTQGVAEYIRDDIASRVEAEWAEQDELDRERAREGER